MGAASTAKRPEFDRPLNLNMVEYSDSLDGVSVDELGGFLAHWDFAPPEGTLFAMLSQSSAIIIARDVESSRVCGYIAALSDGVAFGFISALEVRPEYRRRGVGAALVNRMVERLNVYGTYLSCAPSMIPFYESLGFSSGTAMSRRR